MKKSLISHTRYNDGKLPLNRECQTNGHDNGTQAEILPPRHNNGIFLVCEVVASVQPLTSGEGCALHHAEGLRQALEHIHKAERQALAKRSYYIRCAYLGRGRCCCCCFHIFLIFYRVYKYSRPARGRTSRYAPTVAGGVPWLSSRTATAEKQINTIL